MKFRLVVLLTAIAAQMVTGALQTHWLHVCRKALDRSTKIMDKQNDVLLKQQHVIEEMQQHCGIPSEQPHHYQYIGNGGLIDGADEGNKRN
jgi:hypothetical protein